MPLINLTRSYNVSQWVIRKFKNSDSDVIGFSTDIHTLDAINYLLSENIVVVTEVQPDKIYLKCLKDNTAP